MGHNVPKNSSGLSAVSLSSFNPNEIWEKEKQKDNELRALRIPTNENSRKTKAQIIEAQNRQRIADISLEKDIERIRNKKAEGGLLTIVREIATSKGRIVLYFEILGLAITNFDRKLAYDIFWAIESTEFYIQKQLDFDIPKPETKKYPLLIFDNRVNIKRCIDTVLEWRVSEDMIVKQLTDMSDCLPPLSIFDTSFRLDPWQKRVLNWIDNNKSVIICAPTSSGKTVLSSYVSFMGRASKLPPKVQTVPKVNVDDDDESSDKEDDTSVSDNSIQRVLFVVPTEPLAWQVCAHFTRLFRENGYHSTNVAIVTNQVTYSPNRNLDEPPLVVVGTPRALESALVKIRGKATWAERPLQGGDGLAKSTLPGGTHHYKWVVYDEVHVLNGEEGAALQRLIKMMNCNFLALSATVGNAEQLRGWFEHIRGQQLNVEVVTAPPETWTETAADDALEENRLVKLQQHSGRFINLQRHVWTSLPGSDTEMDLLPLHPLAAVESVSHLQRGIFEFSSLPMTPADSYRLWDRLSTSTTETGEPLFPPEAIQDADPHKCFGQDERITLQRTKDYEDYLKQVLEDLAISYPDRTQTLLESFRITDPPLQFDLCDLVLNLREKQMLPALVFHLDAFHLIKLFKQLLGGLEYRQKNKYPTYYHSLLAKQMEVNAEIDSAKEGIKTEKEIEEAMRFSDMPTVKYAVDLTQPHPEFVLARKQLTEQELKDICFEIEREDK